MSSEIESVIVADSSPLIGLARIGQLDLLRRSGRKILVPPAVWDEVTLQGRGAPGATEVRQAAAWLGRFDEGPDHGGQQISQERRRGVEPVARAPLAESGAHPIQAAFNLMMNVGGADA